jgi:hypothetical protein
LLRRPFIAESIACSDHPAAESHRFPIEGAVDGPQRRDRWPRANIGRSNGRHDAASPENIGCEPTPAG